MPDPNHMDIDQIYLKPPLSSGGRGTHPWKVTIIPNPTFPETGTPYALVQRGSAWDSRFNFEQFEVTNADAVLEDGLAITGESIVYLSHTIDSDSATVDIAPTGSFDFVLPADAFTDPDIEVTEIQHPLARIIDNPDPPDDPTPAQRYIVDQLSSTALAKSMFCYDGIGLPAFAPR
jgi:hypothetical protein